MATIQAKKREKNEVGKKHSKLIRKTGDVPAIIYGADQESVAISLSSVDFLKQLNTSEYKKNQIFEIEIGDKKERVITKEISVNPLNNQFIHIDFLRVSDDKELEVNIPITVEGVSTGQRMGGVLVKPKATVELKCLPSNIPVEIIINVENLGIGQNIRAGELNIGEGQSLNGNPKDILVKIESTKVSKVAEAGEIAAAESDSASEDGAEASSEENESAA